MFEETDTKTGARRAGQTTGKAETFVYDDAKRLATYTGKAQHQRLAGQRHRRKDRAVPEAGRSMSWNAPKPMAPTARSSVREGQRLAKGDHLTYTAADDNT